jgi:cell division protein FtsI (penicillin-binding protein 3)
MRARRGRAQAGALTVASESHVDTRRRVVMLRVALVVVLALFAGRLVELQAVRGETLAGAALDQRLRTTEIPAARGAILDANGQPLALSIDARNITADQTLVEDPVATGKALAAVLGADAATIAERLAGTRRFIYVAKGISPQTWDRIEELALPGIFSEPTTRRIYPAGTTAANILGFVGADGAGLGGVEYAYESLLAGEPGSMTYERGPGGRPIPTAVQQALPAVPGSAIQLTINSDIQFAAQRALEQALRRARADSGTVVVMEPKTGRILALVALPTFDPGKPGASPAEDRGNRALSDVFEPGSTSKVMTLAAVIEEGKATPTSVLKLPPTLERGDKVFRDVDPHGTINMTLAGIMARSSNIGTILAAERIGGRQLWKYLRKFGIGSPTGLNFPGESAGKLRDYSTWTATSFPTIAFGQGVSVNALQVASVYSTIANDGLRLTPRLVEAVIAPDGTVAETPPGKRVRVVSPQTARDVRRMLELVVSDRGTAPAAQIDGYRVGGKTGTAMYVDPDCGCYADGVVASFVGLAPADDPELVVAVSIVNPRNGRYGGQLAAPVFRKVMSYALQAQHVAPTSTKASYLPVMSGE